MTFHSNRTLDATPCVECGKRVGKAMRGINLCAKHFEADNAAVEDGSRPSPATFTWFDRAMQGLRLAPPFTPEEEIEWMEDAPSLSWDEAWG